MPSTMTPETLNTFLEERHVAIIATINNDGVPNPMPIWYIHRDGALLMRTGTDSAKAKNIRRDPRISIVVQSEQLPYKSVTVWGAATLSADDRDLRRDIAVRYLGERGADSYLKMSDSESAVIITLRPARTFSQDYTPETTAAQP